MSDLQDHWAERASLAAIAASEDTSAAYREMVRPFYLLKPRVFPDGNAWIALYGENIQEGICGCGDTPAAASYDFDKSFFSYRLPGRAA